MKTFKKTRATKNQLEYVKGARNQIKSNSLNIKDVKAEIEKREDKIELLKKANMDMEFNIEKIIEYGEGFEL